MEALSVLVHEAHERYKKESRPHVTVYTAEPVRHSFQSSHDFFALIFLL